jgi:acetyl-CoA carboxylase biotin carboxyl carrier protein
MNEDVTFPTSIGELCRCAVELIGAGGAGIRRLRLQTGEVSIELEWPEIAAAPSPAVVLAEDTGLHRLHAPLVGTFFLAPEPGAAPFVGVGDAVGTGQQLAIVEAMKLMNPIEADRPGRVVEILVSDGTPVEYGQPLFVLAPLDAS